MNVRKIDPRRGSDTLRIEGSDGLVVVENYGGLPKGNIMIDKHAFILICTEGMAQFDYDGKTIQLHKGDIFLYIILRSVISNFMSSPDFNCHQIWFTKDEAWNISMYGKTSLTDLVSLKQHPKSTLTEAEADLLESYFQLLCRQMRDRDTLLYTEIVRSLIGTLLLRILSFMRSKNKIEDIENSQDSSMPYVKSLADRFIELLEKSDGRIRRVDDFASQLNVSPKHLSTVLMETIKRRPSEMIAIFTIKAIEQRLRFTNMTMQEIAYDLNFPNASFFGKYVKSHLGMTPMEFRKKYTNT